MSGIQNASIMNDSLADSGVANESEEQEARRL
jgi:hypothetical protein